MAATTLKTFADVQTLLNAFVASAQVNPAQAPHGVFWSKDYQSFINGSVLGQFKILVVGDSKNSNIIKALNGTLSGIPRMPRPSPPYNDANPSQDEVIAALSAWIDAGCPNPTGAAKPKSGAKAPAKKPGAKSGVKA